MGTGVKPLDGDYDLDVAIVFDLDTEDYPDPVVVKSWVFDAVMKHTENVRMREPCVTVFYQDKGEFVYHVDLAIYGQRGESKPIRLARGRKGGAEESRRWEDSDPKALLETVRDRFADEDGAQFRRCIRYLKRWKDFKFPSDGNAAPLGIALTACGLHCSSRSRPPTPSP